MEEWTEQLVRPPQPGIQLVDWWQKELAQLPKKTRKTKAVKMMYCAWNVWKESNRRVFKQKRKTTAEVMHEIKLEVDTRKRACSGSELP